MKKLAVFDLDGTLAESKSAITSEMSSLLEGLLGVAQVAVISGGGWPQFESQLLANLSGSNLEGLSLLPTCGTQFYQFDKKWVKLYSEDLTPDERERIKSALEKGVVEAGFTVEKTWGDVIEDRGSQITMSALGQEAPLSAKESWDPDFKKRKAIVAIVEKIIPEFAIRMGGTTSIDVTKPGIDKAFGIEKLHKILKINLDEMIFFGDALFPGGNDYAVFEAGVDSVRVRDPEETSRNIQTMIACLK